MCSSRPANIVTVLILAYLSHRGQSGTYLNKPRFQWEGGVVPFYFRNVTQNNQNLLKSLMKKIESKTCLRFKPGSDDEEDGHHLDIYVSSRSCLVGGRPVFSASVSGVDNSSHMVLQSHYSLADNPKCRKETSGGILHELFHVFGVMHTQQRRDRNKYIDVLESNIQDKFKFEYEICQDCNDLGVPYDCRSIMHAGLETFTTGFGKPTMRARNNKTCSLKSTPSAFDGTGASESDWLLLRKIADRLCSKGSKTKTFQKIIPKSSAAGTKKRKNTTPRSSGTKKKKDITPKSSGCRKYKKDVFISWGKSGVKGPDFYPSTSAEECHRKCRKEKQCVAWNFNVKLGCNLKKAEHGETFKKGWTAGFKDSC